ncbi:hypothetical protein [Enterococcus italicus]|uniref:hypothetical protein n=1 Tax=Enterococcus italicus TaxID=246144 RepID=UPI003F458504
MSDFEKVICYLKEKLEDEHADAFGILNSFFSLPPNHEIIIASCNLSAEEQCELLELFGHEGLEAIEYHCYGDER